MLRMCSLRFMNEETSMRFIKVPQITPETAEALGK